jgi:hypothetical protein
MKRESNNMVEEELWTVQLEVEVAKCPSER